MKVKKIIANNRKKAFEVSTAQAVYDFPYSRLALKPTEQNPILEVYSDPEVGHQGFTYRLASGNEYTVALDQVLEYCKDPEYLRRDLLFRLTVKAQNQMKESKISKREVIRRMGTTPSQFYRLMDQRNTNKSIDQMVRLLAALDCTVDLVFPNAA